ncbi:MinD/ParA family protein [Desulfocurvibacter africanus]|uniref:MinD/ParA family protein n=1 Tax=Desulfocurvibacter africanus TaxID=873 RepID=UPI0004097DC8|nr:MinD/ParA family protein [Desulfocurvibacter africanus]
MTGTDARPEATRRGAARIVSVASGKGGVGKTSVAVNLAWALARAGRKVCLLDADLGLSNVDIYLGIRPEKTLEDVLFAGLPMEQALVPAGRNVDVISGSSGVTRMAELDRERRSLLTREFSKLNSYDYLIIDNSPGIAAQVMSICLSSDDIVMVVNPEAASVTDAYAFIKVLKENGLWRQPLVLLNRCRDRHHARTVFERFNETTRRYLSVTCRPLGAVPLDGNLPRSAALRQPVLETSPNSPASLAFLNAARILDADFEEGGAIRSGVRDFWDQSVIHLQQKPRVSEAAIAESPPSLGAVGVDRTRLTHDLRLLEAMLARVRGSAQAEPLVEDLEKVSRALRIIANRYATPPTLAVESLEGLETGMEPAPAARSSHAAADKPAPVEPSIQPSTHEDDVQVESVKGLLVICPDPYMRDVLMELAKDAGFRAVGGYATRQEAGRSAEAADLLLVSDGDNEPLDLGDILEHSSGRPVVLLDGFEGSPQVETFRERLAAVVYRPFRIGALLDVLRRFA